ncbi:universal stress protein [Klebsiella pneumoniae]
MIPASTTTPSRGQHLLAMKALRQKFGIDEKFTHVEKGLPEEVIPDLAEHLQAGIVVLGTVGRTGLSAAFLSAIPRNRLSTTYAVTCWC